MRSSDRCLAKQTMNVPWSESLSAMGIVDESTFILAVDELGLLDRDWKRVLQKVSVPVLYLLTLFTPYFVSISFPRFGPRLVVFVAGFLVWAFSRYVGLTLTGWGAFYRLIFLIYSLVTASAELPSSPVELAACLLGIGARGAALIAVTGWGVVAF